ncbi:four-helix bundle copper-binding protein [Jeotgalibacillus marinus]|uniref:Four-helix bundle copper-binding protein n=1 Tax=Jeotgalibacillus marinus TaxID=86667 RepID=A0ABV3Q6F5_9BACL
MYPINKMPYPMNVTHPMTAYPNGNIFLQHRLLHTVQNCEATCEFTRNEILKMEGCRKEQLKLLSDCANMCTLMAKYIASKSIFAKSLACLCAEVCQVCGEHCIKHPDKISQACGQSCLHCAQECREFASARH